ncbi:MAG: hypothetical protein FWD33_01360 [Alphaproteobacteria bacterium]|nr:hypothetical protein [Alphaproteobacteria bacterium]
MKSNLTTLLIIAAAVVAAVAIGYTAGSKDPNFYNKLQQAEHDAGECAKDVYKDAKERSRKMFGRDKKYRSDKSDKAAECPETPAVVIETVEY